MASHDNDHLDAVYAAKGPQDIARLYDDWAGSYDADMAKAGYRHPAIATALLARHLPKGAAPILDAGAGTGLVGEWLGILGYPEVEALDISAGMLAVARAKGVYQALHIALLGGDLPVPKRHFAGVVCAGVLTTGHVGAEALPGLLAVTRPGGVLVLTVKETLWADSFAAAVTGAPEAQVVEATEPYISMPGETGATPSRAVVLART
ncbi:class I SAM-dependent DNA methyltransferase [Palleronia sp. KMU-117]|uniref:class I SAM-dependent DNA methyltransferase n=1 Tax=Palleronia sp. KMU-117 TaxID=3434108 RepID=UPI003D739FD9